MAIEEFDLYIKPEPDLIIWRYMDLEKFESLVKDQSLFFCRADRFSDPFEGSIPKREAENRIKESIKISEERGYQFDYKTTIDSIQGISYLHKQIKEQIIINCWHINNSENDSMWRLYLKSNEGIAIKSSVDRLLHSFIGIKELVHCSKVRYLDYENDIWYHKIDYPFQFYNMYIPLIHKRIEFQQEKELRLIHQIDTDAFSDKYWSNQPFEKGKNINVRIFDLIDKVYTAPTCDDQQIEKIQRIIKKNGFKFEIKKSVLSNEPYY